MAKENQKPTKNKRDIALWQESLDGFKSDLAKAEAEHETEIKQLDKKITDLEAESKGALDSLEKANSKTLADLDAMLKKIFMYKGFSGGVKTLVSIFSWSTTDRAKYPEFITLDRMVAQNPQAKLVAEKTMYDALKEAVSSKKEVVIKVGEAKKSQLEIYEKALDILLGYLEISKEDQEKFNSMKPIVKPSKTTPSAETSSGQEQQQGVSSEQPTTEPSAETSSGQEQQQGVSPEQPTTEPSAETSSGQEQHRGVSSEQPTTDTQPIVEKKDDPQTDAAPPAVTQAVGEEVPETAVTQNAMTGLTNEVVSSIEKQEASLKTGSKDGSKKNDIDNSSNVDLSVDSKAELEGVPQLSEVTPSLSKSSDSSAQLAQLLHDLSDLRNALGGQLSVGREENSSMLDSESSRFIYNSPLAANGGSLRPSNDISGGVLQSIVKGQDFAEQSSTSSTATGVEVIPAEASATKGTNTGKQGVTQKKIKTLTEKEIETLTEKERKKDSNKDDLKPSDSKSLKLNSVLLEDDPLNSPVSRSSFHSNLNDEAPEEEERRGSWRSLWQEYGIKKRYVFATGSVLCVMMYLLLKGSSI
ncbi:hypothetical protein [Candidatus Paracaedibacter symbiosus]|uniref:hypothetical protein n=1 Tax=Candidatus Paracaedibacter symbiosus TaxID=244582 RepID=UPI000A47BCE9|nr:hypothetical protein [Candidatus Paracaedibacter symbiosus]